MCLWSGELVISMDREGGGEVAKKLQLRKLDAANEEWKDGRGVGENSCTADRF